MAFQQPTPQAFYFSLHEQAANALAIVAALDDVRSARAHELNAAYNLAKVGYLYLLFSGRDIINSCIGLPTERLEVDSHADKLRNRPGLLARSTADFIMAPVTALAEEFHIDQVSLAKTSQLLLRHAYIFFVSDQDAGIEGVAHFSFWLEQAMHKADPNLVSFIFGEFEANLRKAPINLVRAVNNLSEHLPARAGAERLADLTKRRDIAVANNASGSEIEILDDAIFSAQAAMLAESTIPACVN